MKALYNILYPGQFYSTKIYTHPKFEEELRSTLKYSGYKQNFIKRVSGLACCNVIKSGDSIWIIN